MTEEMQSALRRLNVELNACGYAGVYVEPLARRRTPGAPADVLYLVSSTLVGADGLRELIPVNDKLLVSAGELLAFIYGALFVLSNTPVETPKGGRGYAAHQHDDGRDTPQLAEPDDMRRG